MTNKQKANLIALLHSLLILTGIISLPLVFIISWWGWFVVALAAASLGFWVTDKDSCWITRLENKYRRENGDHYEISFLQHYLKKVFNIKLSSRTIDMILYSYTLLLFVVAIVKIIKTSV